MVGYKDDLLFLDEGETSTANVNAVGFWGQSAGVSGTSGTVQKISFAASDDNLLSTDKKLYLEGSYNGSALTLGDTYLLYNSGTSDVEFFVNGIKSLSVDSSSVSADHFVATSTTATSTFAGGLTVDGTDFVVDPDSGRVGIGTSNPQSTLNISGSSPIVRMDAGSGGNNNIQFYENGALHAAFLNRGSTDALEFINYIAAPLRFVTNSVDRIFIDGSGNLGFGGAMNGSTIANSYLSILQSSGNVGIGNSSPNEKLNVQGEVAAQYFTATSTTASTLPYASSTSITASGSAYISGFTIHNDGSANVIRGDSGSGLKIISDSGFHSYGGNSSVTYTHEFIGEVGVMGGNGLTLEGGGNLNVSGKIGINSGLTYNLDVAGNARFTSLVDASHFVATSTSATSTFAGGLTVDGTDFVVDPDGGRVGIGKSNPSARLDIDGLSSLNPLTLDSDGGATDSNRALNFNVDGLNYGKITIPSGGGGAMAFWTGSAGASAERLRISSTGNLGIGTTSPYAKLSVAGSGVFGNNLYTSYITATSTTATSTFAGGVSIGNGVFEFEPASGIASLQNVELGAMSFDTDAGIVSWTDLPVSGTPSSGTVQSYTAQIDGTSLLTVYAEADGSGGIQNSAVGVATTTPWRTLSVSGTVGFAGLNTLGSSGDALCLTGENEVKVNSGVQTCTVSSQRYKNNIQEAAGNLDIVLALKPSTFTYIGSSTTRFGLIAEEVELIDPRLVARDREGAIQSVHYPDLTAVLVGAVQDLSKKIES